MGEEKPVTMAVCEVCGNDYHWAFQVNTSDGQTRTFDSFECAIAAVAPRCAHCGCRIIGHGVETARGVMFCCGHCARTTDAQPEGQPAASQNRDTDALPVSPFVISPD